MAKFRIFNVQLTPFTDEFGDIGISGYKSIWAHLRDATRAHRSARTLHNFHKNVGPKSFFGPMETHVARGYVWGHFVRYTTLDRLDELYTARLIHKTRAGSVGVSGQKQVLFIFDCVNHALFIEEKAGGLPPTSQFVEMLRAWIEPIAGELFPNHGLKIIQLSDRSSLERVLNDAVGYGRIQVNLTFPNGPSQDGALEEMKIARMRNVNIEVSSGGKGRISKTLPSFFRELILGATMYGRAHMTYYYETAEGQRRATYDTADTPRTVEARQRHEESDSAFVDRVLVRLRGAFENGSDDEDSLGETEA